MCTLLVHRVVFVSPITSAFPYTHKELRFFGIAEHNRGEREREGGRERERESIGTKNLTALNLMHKSTPENEVKLIVITIVLWKLHQTSVALISTARD